MNTNPDTWQVYSVNGRLMHSGSDEATARRGLQTWPKAWTLLKNGQAVDLNPKPIREEAADAAYQP